MKLQKKQLNQIEIIYNKIKQYCTCIFIGGSYTYSFLNSHHDIDVFIVCPTDEDRKNARNFIRKEDKECMDILASLKQNDHLVIMVTTEFAVLQWFAFSYQYNFKDAKVLFGNSIDFPKDIFTYKGEYLAALQYTSEKIHFFLEKDNKVHKDLYYMLTGVYMLQNGSYDLTPEQIENINICHEYQDQDKMKVLLKYCDDYLESQK